MNDNNVWKLKYTSILPLQLVSIGTFLIFCILVNIFLYHKYKATEEKLQLLLLNLYTKRIEGFILQDFQKALKPSYKAKDFFATQNSTYKSEDKKKLCHKRIYLSSNILYVKKGDKDLIVELSNIKRMLDSFSKDLFLYTIKINNEQVLTNTMSELVDTLSNDHLIAENILLNISIEHDKQSEPIRMINANVKDEFFQAMCLSVGIFLVGIVIILRYIKKEKELVSETNHKNDILSFLNKNREFILKCYEYSKKSRSIMQNDLEDGTYRDYLPLSIIYDIDKKKRIEINVDRIVYAIKDYFYSYKAYHQLDNVELNLIHGNIKDIVIPFDYEVLYQVIISIIYNLMNFNKKSSDKRKIVMDFSKEQIIISSDGLKLNKEYAIKASEMIFLDTANPYLMNFGQIFVLLNKHNIKFDVCGKKHGTVITIMMPLVEKAEHKGFAGVVSIDKYRKKKI